MKNEYDEPKFIDVVSGSSSDSGIFEEFRALCHDEPFAVLATQSEGQPYVSLISYALSDDLEHLVFSTPVQTRKYSEIIENPEVSILIDNRSRQPESINLIRGVTITGRARPLENPAELEHWSGILAGRHSYLEKFIKSPSSGLILVQAAEYFYVRRFQEVYRWIPQKNVS